MNPALVEECIPLVRQWARMKAPKGFAEDLEQDVLLKLLQGPEPTTNIKSYVITTLLHRLAEWTRRTEWYALTFDTELVEHLNPAAVSPDPLEGLEAQQRAELAHKLLTKIKNPDRRQAIDDYFFHDWSQSPGDNCTQRNRRLRAIREMRRGLC